MQQTLTESAGAAKNKNKSALVTWVLQHDSKMSFNVLYIGLAVILSIWLGLFWLVAVVAAHGMIELYRQILLGQSFRVAIFESIWEIKLDIGLIIFAFWLDIYLGFIFGIAGLSAGARTAANLGSRAAQTGTRAVVWQRLIRGVFISLDDLGLAFRAMANRKKDQGVEKQEASTVTDTATNYGSEITGKSSWAGKYTTGDWLSLGFGFTFMMLILLAPVLIDKSYQEVAQIILKELRPFP